MKWTNFEFIGFDWIMIIITLNWTLIGLNWTVLLKCLEITFFAFWRYINKTELNLIMSCWDIFGRFKSLLINAKLMIPEGESQP